MAFVACNEADDMGTSDGNAADGLGIIRVGGVSADGLAVSVVTTRAAGDPIDEETVVRTDAENVEWLRGPLFDGLDITYGLAANRTGTSRVARLTLLQDPEDSGIIKYSVDGANRYAEYSFMFRDDETGELTSNPAIWHGNGAHFFEGLYIPGPIQYTGSDAAAVYDESSGTAKKLTTDQHDATTTGTTLGNYTLLSHYLAMPSNFTLNATVARVKLPFRHRLARVIAYILIDPEMGDNVAIKGYKMAADGETPVATEDPTTTAIKFCNVGVLSGVKDDYDTKSKHHTYTPQWTNARKVIPHFVDERGSYNDKTNTSLNDAHFIAFLDTQKGKYIYPTDDEWATVNALTFTADTNGKLKDPSKRYEKTIYGKVPVYDLIVQPTYTSLANVMYDEEAVNDSTTKSHLYQATNQIDFELTLNTGLHYTKNFIFDLDANYQTVVYLHISRERVDYNSSGNDVWQETIGYDDYYGVNNQNGNNLSMAGSSWQRAYTNSETQYRVTDGHLYKHDEEDEYAQYVADARWIEMLREAHEGGLHHGDYFILDHDLSIPAAAFPEGFVFTGHLDGQDHTITISDGDYTKITHPVTYVPYVQNEAGTVTKYMNLGEIFSLSYDFYEELIAWTDPLYELDEEDNYVPIADPYAYDGDHAYFYDPFAEEYKQVNFYMKDYSSVKTETVEAKSKPYYLFAGLNGKYSTAQESNLHAEWEANVHAENFWDENKRQTLGPVWVPYRHEDPDNAGVYIDGWRAEIINTNFVIDTDNGCSVFSPTAVWGTHVTGYLHNCWVNSTYSGTPPKWSGTPIQEYTPSLPEYKVE